MKCPGQNTRYWKQNAIYNVKCPKCESNVEFFKDDTIRKCKKCEHRFLNPSMDFGCASYCEHAAECIGNLSSELIKQKNNLFKDRVAIEMKKYFKTDFKLISHAIKVARYAENIGKNEPNSNLVVVLCAAYLNDIGIHEVKKNNHEVNGSVIAKIILEKLNADIKVIKEVCNIINHHHHPINKETINYKIVYDANLIANIENDNKDKLINPEMIKNIINKSFMTNTGKEYAIKILLKK